MGLNSEARPLTVGQAFPRTPEQHAEVLHPLKANGVVFGGRILPNGRWAQQGPYRPWELDAALYGVAETPDIYLTMNRFEGARRVLQQHVRELSALYTDIDFYDVVPTLAGRTPGAVFELALERLRSAGIPEPTLAICSGQGLYAGWLHSPVGWKELPRWQDCQYRLCRLLRPLGADPKARDAARVLRLVGTTNSKNGAAVHARLASYDSPSTGMRPAVLRETAPKKSSAIGLAQQDSREVWCNMEQHERRTASRRKGRVA